MSSNRLTIGRTDEASLMLPDSGLSRVHASINREGDRVWILDENSTNGTEVNGQMVPPSGTVLSDGDEIALGNHTTITVSIGITSSQAQSARPQSAGAPSIQAVFAGLNPRLLVVYSALFAMLVISIVIVVMVFSGGSKGRGKSSKAESKRQSEKQTSKSGGEALTEPDVQEVLVDGWDVSEPPTEPEEVSDEAVRQALFKVREERGEPTGVEAAGVNVPTELKQYSERSRFLAIQSAEAVEQNLRIPHDFAELTLMIRDKEYVELKPLGESYVLYAVGGGASQAFFTHFDKSTEKSVPIFKTDAEMQSAIGTMPDSDPMKSFIAAYYKSSQSRQVIESEYNSLSQLAGDFDKRTYDLNDGAARKQYRRRMLSFLRPQALKVLEELGLAYKNKFNRLLPVASLIRTIEYQRELSERNVNAAQNALPPHTTGLAFDVSYRYMTAAEQNFIMGEIAKMEAAGRVEALRENNNSYHIFTFLNGRPPSESAIRRFMK